MKLDRYSQITFNQDKLKAQLKLDALKRRHRMEQVKEGVLGALFLACLIACLWLGLLLFP
jgi:hypothetical protein